LCAVFCWLSEQRFLEGNGITGAFALGSASSVSPETKNDRATFGSGDTGYYELTNKILNPPFLLGSLDLPFAIYRYNFIDLSSNKARLPYPFV